LDKQGLNIAAMRDRPVPGKADIGRTREMSAFGTKQTEGRPLCRSPYF
jgi:hypothetical protein